MSGSKLHKLIDDLRSNGLDDNTIRETAKSTGYWKESEIEIALSGLNLEDYKEEHAPSINNLWIVLHHILLWFFLFATVPALISLVNYIIDRNLFDSSFVLISFIVIVSITGGLYYFSLKKVFHDKKEYVKTKVSTVLSILTIAHALIAFISTMIVLIIAILEALLEREADNGALMICAFLIAILSFNVFMTYISLDFMKKENPYRDKISIISPIANAVMIIILFLITIVYVPGTIKDNNTIQDTIDLSQSIYDYTEENKNLPSAQYVSTLGYDNIDYKAIEPFSYELCMDFVYGDNSRSSFRDNDKITNYINSWELSYREAGNNCYIVEMDSLKENEKYNIYDDEILFPYDSDYETGIELYTPNLT